MSIQIQTVNTVSENKTRSPAVSPTNTKNMVFMYWVLQQMQLSEELLEQFYSKINLFSAVADQIEFFKTFETDYKSVTKDMRAFIKKRLTPPKPKFSREKTAKKVKSDEPKRGRKKKDVPVVIDNQDSLISELVALANSNTPIDEIIVPSTPPPTVVSESPKVQPKPKVQPTESSIQPTESSIQPKEKKPRAKKPKVPTTTESSVQPTESSIQPTESSIQITSNDPETEVIFEPVVATKPKKPRTKKPKATPVQSTTEPLVQPTEPLVQPNEPLVQPTEPSVQPTEPSVQVATKKPRAKKSEGTKPRAKKTVQEKIEEAVTITEELIQEPMVQATVQDEQEHEQEEEEEEVQARVLVYSGKQYLIDESNTVYDYTSFEPIGTYNTITEILTLN